MPKPLPRDRYIQDLVTLVEAAEILHVSRQALHKAAKKGQILGADLGHGVWVFRRVLVEREAASPEGQKRVDAWHAKHPGEPCACRPVSGT